MEQRDDWHLTELLHHDHGRGDPFAAAVRATRMPMVITDPAQSDNPIVFANQAFQALSGYERHEIIGRNCRFLQGPKSAPGSIAKIRAAVAEGSSIDIDLLNYRKDGSTFWNALYLSPVRSDDGKIQFFFASQLDATDRVDAHSAIARQKEAVEREVASRTSELQAALQAKTLMLHEVDHRVKNNLTMIGSLLRLQARDVGDPEVAGKLGTMLERVDALASVHRRLYQAEDITRFDLGAFAVNLVSDVLGASGRTDIVLHEEIEPVLISSDSASVLGLALNEIVTNAIKHGFRDGRSGTLAVRARQGATGATISVDDDGPGIDGDEIRKDGLGRTLIDRLARQANASIRYRRLSPGTGVDLVLPRGENS